MSYLIAVKLAKQVVRMDDKMVADFQNVSIQNLYAVLLRYIN